MGTIDQRPLKGFVRFDGSGRIVAGSLILRRKMPKVGKWEEIPAYECCNPPTTAFPEPCNTLEFAKTFVVLGATTDTNTGSSIVTGDLGLYPGTSVVGFPPGIVVGTKHITDIAAQVAQLSASTAFDCLSSFSPLGTLGADIGGTTVTAGAWTFASTADITGVLTLDGGGDPNAVFIFQIPSTLTTASASSVVLTNGAQAGNVYWIVGSSATIGTTSHMIGTIIALTSVTMTTGATLNGRAFALTAAVTLDTNLISAQACTINPCLNLPTTTTTSTSSTTTTTTTTGIG